VSVHHSIASISNSVANLRRMRFSHFLRIHSPNRSDRYNHKSRTAIRPEMPTRDPHPTGTSIFRITSFLANLTDCWIVERKLKCTDANTFRSFDPNPSRPIYIFQITQISLSSQILPRKSTSSAEEGNPISDISPFCSFVNRRLQVLFTSTRFN
jgi:hypothetical protein